MKVLALLSACVCAVVLAAPAQARVQEPRSDWDLLRPLYGLVWAGGGFVPVVCPPEKFCW